MGYGRNKLWWTALCLWWAVQSRPLDAPIHQRLPARREPHGIRRARRAVARKFHPGHLGRRPLGGHWPDGRPFGRSEVVAEFHRLRQLDLPPVFVIQGPRGHQKSELIDYLRFSNNKRWALVAEERDSKVDLFAIDPEPETVLASVSRQLTASKSFSRPLRFPRLARVQALLTLEQLREGLPPSQMSAVEADRNWLAAAGVQIVNRAADISIPTPPRSVKLNRWLHAAWWKISPTAAGRWVRGLQRGLPAQDAAATSRRERLERLRDGLTKALVEDLRKATRRRLLPIAEVVVFIDGYHRVERSSQPDFIVELANQLAASRARVMLVVACREQILWSKLAQSQPDYQNFSSMETSERIQIHHLAPIGWSERIRSLFKDEVPAPLAGGLAELSLGMPVMLNLFGAAFGNGKNASRNARALLDELPTAERFDNEWFERCSRIVARYTVKELDHSLKLHLRAAATQRNFDKALLAKLLGSHFVGEHYEELVSSDLVGTPRPSLLLDGKQTYRVRSFVREVLAADDTELNAVTEWHRLAHDYFEASAKASQDPDLAFLLETEALFHRLFIEPGVAKPELLRRFQVQLLALRTDRCEGLLRAALDFEKKDTHWRATCLVHAGKMYLARGRYEWAEERLVEAKGLLSLDEKDPELAVATCLALARCYRLQERFALARRELRSLSGRNVHNVVEFMSTWSESLEAKFEGRLATSVDRADECRHLLKELLAETNVDDSAHAAERYGVGGLPRKRFHISRHEADIARRAGDYPASLAKVKEALTGYEEDPEDGIEAYTELVRVHLLRQEGHFNSSFDLAQNLFDEFTAPPSEDLRGAVEAKRCMAHATLCGPEPEFAREMLEELTKADPVISSQARRFGFFGLGELERLQGHFGQARSFYDLSEQVNDSRPRFESLYAELGQIEIERIERPERVAGGVRQLLRQTEVREHPSFVFYATLLELRAFGPAEGRETAVRAAEARFRRLPGSTNWELRTLANHVAAFAAGTSPPAIVFNLP